MRYYIFINFSNSIILFLLIYAYITLGEMKIIPYYSDNILYFLAYQEYVRILAYMFTYKI